MATKTSILIETTKQNSDSTQNKSLTNINPDATDADLLTFTKEFTKLSTKTFSKSFRIDKKELSST